MMPASASSVIFCSATAHLAKGRSQWQRWMGRASPVSMSCGTRLMCVQSSSLAVKMSVNNSSRRLCLASRSSQLLWHRSSTAYLVSTDRVWHGDYNEVMPSTARSDVSAPLARTCDTEDPLPGRGTVKDLMVSRGDVEGPFKGRGSGEVGYTPHRWYVVSGLWNPGTAKPLAHPLKPLSCSANPAQWHRGLLFWPARTGGWWNG